MATITGSTIFPAGVATWVRDCADLGASNARLTIISGNGVISYDCRYCGDYAVYYTNKYGGWCAFLFEGICKRIDNLKDYKYNRATSNQTINFENNRYLVEVSPTYQLRTGWLSDEEAARLASDLLPTTKMYLHNLITDEIKPAIITDTSAEYKTFKNNNRKFVQYTVSVQESQTKLRR